jgi:hypothetical protein
VTVPSPSDFEDRLAALESRALTLRDLPISALQRKLEQDWQPDPAVLLGEGTISLTMLDGIDRGSDSLVWPGGSPESNVLNVTHDVGRLPNIQVTATSRVGAAAIAVWVGSVTTSGFQVRARTLDGTNPLAAAAATFDWRAEG